MPEINITPEMEADLQQAIQKMIDSKPKMNQSQALSMVLDQSFKIIQKHCFPVKVYFESESHADLVALIDNENTYEHLDNTFNQIAQSHRMIVTQSVE